jgi:hypothetical protein
MGFQRKKIMGTITIKKKIFKLKRKLLMNYKDYEINEFLNVQTI